MLPRRRSDPAGHVVVAAPARCEPDDVLLVCTDGLWGPLKDEEIASRLWARAARCATA